MSFLKHTAKSFDTNGTEGMLDVILGCTLVFILLSSLIQVGQAQAQEKTLPAMDMTKTSSQHAGSQRIKKTSISIKKVDGKMNLYLDAKAISLGGLKNTLQNLKGIGHIALRRDKNVPCGWEDEIILVCQESGIDRVSIVVSINNVSKK